MPRGLPALVGAAIWMTVVVAVPGIDAQAQDWELRRQPGKRPANRPTARPGGKRPTRPRPSGEPTSSEPTAQDNDPRRRELPILLARYRRAIEADPREGFPLARLLDITRELHGSLDPLIAELQHRIESEPQPFVARMLLGHVFKAAARRTEALAEYEAATQLRPTSPLPLLAAGELAGSTDLAQARRLFERALPLLTDQAERGELLRKLMEIALDQDEVEAARRYFEQIVAHSPRSVFQRMEWGQALVQHRKFELASTAFEEVVRFARGDARAAVPALRELARCHIELGQTDEALSSLRRALAIAGEASGLRRELLELLTELYRRGDDLTGLIAELERGGAVGGFERDELLGRLYDEIGDEVHALGAYRRALGRNPRNIDTRIRVIQLLQRSGRSEEVRDEYQRLIRTAPTEPRFAIELAEIYFQEGERARALQLLQSLGARFGADPELHTKLTELYMRLGETERATHELQILSRIDPAEPSHIVALGEQQFQEGQRDRALETWRRLLHLGTDRARARANLGDVLGDHDMIPAAIELYREAIAVRDDDVELHKGLASLLERNRDLEQAAVEWHRVLELSGNDRVLRREARTRIVGIWHLSRTLPSRLQGLEARFGNATADLEAGRFLGEGYLKLRRLGDAERALRRVVALAPGDIESYLSLERVLVQKGDLAGAVEVLKRLAELEPRRAREFYQRIATYALQIYRDDEALEFASRAVDLNSSDAQAHARLAQLFRSRQDYDSAMASYRRAIELNDRLFPTYFELAELHLMRGQSREADRLYRQIIRGAPDDEMVTRAARLAIQLNGSANTLEDLERELTPVALAQTRRPVFRRALVDLYSRLVWPLVQQARHGVADEASLARAKLVRIGQRALKPLLEALADDDPSQKRAAVEILGYLGNANAALPLLAAAESDSVDIEIRSRALGAAVALADSRLLGRLEGLANDPDIRIRLAAVWGLVRMRDRRAAPALVRAASAPVDPVRAFGCIGLGELGDLRHLPLLLLRLDEEAPVLVATAAAIALGRLGRGEAVDALGDALRRNGEPVRRAAAMSLGVIGDPRAADALAEALFDEDPELRAIAAWGLSRLGSGREMELPQVDYFRLPDGRIDPPLFMTSLVQPLPPGPPTFPAVVAHRDAIERALAAALASRPERARVALEAMLAAPSGLGLAPLTDDSESASPAQADGLETALRSIAAAVTARVVGLVTSPDVEVRRRAVAVLGRTGGAAAVDALLIALRDTSEVIQRQAIEMLADVGDARAAGLLQRTLADSNAWAVRAVSASTLGRLGDRSAAPALAQALQLDRYAFVRSAAAEALGELAEAADVTALEQALMRDDEPLVRIAAARALAKVASPRALAALRRTQDADREVQRQIRQLLHGIRSQ